MGCLGINLSSRVEIFLVRKQCQMEFRCNKTNTVRFSKKKLAEWNKIFVGKTSAGRFKKAGRIIQNLMYDV